MRARTHIGHHIRVNYQIGLKGSVILVGTSQFVDFPIIKRQKDTATITQQMVDRAEEAMLKEEADYYGKFM